MCITLHLLLGDRHPHELQELHITRSHMLTFHRALLERLIVGTPPDLWRLGCLHRDINPPSLAHTGPYPTLSIHATTTLPRGQPWRPKKHTSVNRTILTGTASVPASLLHTLQPGILSPLAPTGHSTDPRALPEVQNPSRTTSTRTSGSTHLASNPPRGIAQKGQGEPTQVSLTSDLANAMLPAPLSDNPHQRRHNEGHLFSKGAIRVGLFMAKRLDTNRRRLNKAKKHATLVDHWPTLRPPSLPVFDQIRTRTLPLPGSLHSYGWRPDPKYKIKHDPPMRAEYPFDCSPPTLLHANL